MVREEQTRNLADFPPFFLSCYQVWKLSTEAFGSFVSTVAPPLSIGNIELESGEIVKGKLSCLFVLFFISVAGTQDSCASNTFCPRAKTYPSLADGETMSQEESNKFRLEILHSSRRHSNSLLDLICFLTNWNRNQKWCSTKKLPLKNDKTIIMENATDQDTL